MEKKRIGTILEDKNRDNLESILDREKYSLESFDFNNLSKYNLIIADSLNFQNIPLQLRENIEPPLLYIHMKGSGLDPTPVHTFQYNFFRIVIPIENDELIRVKELPSRDNVTEKNITEIIDRLSDIKQYITDNILSLEDINKENGINREIWFTGKGDYGPEYFPQRIKEELRKIRGKKRTISRAEAVYQAIKVKKLLQKEDVDKLKEKSAKVSEPQKESSLDTKVLVLMEDLPTSYMDELKKRNYSILCIKDIAEGLELLDKEKFNLVITDIEELIAKISKLELGYVALLSINQLPEFAYPGAVINVSDTPDSTSSFALFSTVKYFVPRTPEDLDKDFIQVLDRVLRDAKVHEQLHAIPDPLDALFNESIKVIAQGEDSEKISSAHEQLRKILRERPDSKYPYSDIIRGYAYEDLEVVSTEKIFSLKSGRASTPIIIKKYKSKRRAKCEYYAYSQIRKYNEEREIKFKDESLPKNEKFYWKHAPKININSILYKPILSENIIFIGLERIAGPTLEQLADELNKRISKEDQKAWEFKRRVIFELNKQLAWHQINPLKIPDNENYEDTDYAANLKESFAGNLQYLNISFSAQEVACLKKCISILMENLRELNSIQYLDFNWRNIVFDAGNDDVTFEDILKIAAKEGKSIKEFVQDRLHKLDYNKIFRRTNKFEDIRHTFSKKRIKQNERNWYDNHFMLYRKKFELLNKIKLRAGALNEHSDAIEDISRLLNKIENSRITKKDKREIRAIISKEKEELSNIDSYLILYRNFRWFDHFLRKYLSKTISKSTQGYDKSLEISDLEKELNYYCSDAKKYVFKLMRTHSSKISNRYIHKSGHNVMNRAELNRDTAREYISLLDELKNKTENIEKTQIAQEYIAAKYVLAVINKMGKLDINYSKLAENYKDE